MDIEALISTAKLGRGRKDAQVDTCAVFAAALFDVLVANNVPCSMATAVRAGLHTWAHAVVEVNGGYYDSMGEFSGEIYRARAKIHPAIQVEIKYHPDSRSDCYEPEFDEYHAFYLKELSRAHCLITKESSTGKTEGQQ